MTEHIRPAQEPWHLDKRVNISVIAGLVLQAIIFGVAWGNIENRVAQLEHDKRLFETVPQRLAGIEATLIAIKERLDRSDRK
jgi:uncharacterized membrane protein YciS (DUF1049 family)